MAILPFDSFLCWKLKIATLAVAFWMIGSGTLSALLEIFDVASLADDNFEIQGGFKAHWRAHVWEGWLACNLVMFICDLILIVYSIVMIFAVKVFPTYYEYNITKGYMTIVIMYILVDLGVALYKYSWYGPNTFRLGFLVFSFLYWLLRTIMNITATLVVYSRIEEIHYEITYGEKKNLSGWEAGLMDAPGMQSGYTTPRQPYGGSRTPLSQSYA
ncbi:hypothetical protein CAPTEDRAFT_201528 [Capitella teleta]|uniref:Uncharacterized protein n=1 Tax=Capitella teleta TaxID=283909 RepID=R7UNE5_CAPTE|nr:hypothetical protein CAPTEDRAFT_201528 [Capitella teleta]|eukprot:ELU07593.1 hypothetical protein CAPTEDRAFT_201528 [Capitella teleta]